MIGMLGFRRVMGSLLAVSCGTPVFLLTVLLLQINSIAWAQQSGPLPGPGPVSPGSGTEGPPEVTRPPGQPTEVPIGRLEGYEEEKRKAQEPHGTPGGAIQEDPAARRDGAGPNAPEGR